jgi:hypothetical protein
MSEQQGRAWWQLVEEHLAAPEHAVDDDPWADRAAAPALTDEQRALLGGDDQPAVTRYAADDHHDDHTADQPPVPRFVHHQHDEHDEHEHEQGDAAGE